MVSSPDNSDDLLSALIAYVPLTGKILDAGCGPGIYARKLKKINDNILGLDLTNVYEKNEMKFLSVLGVSRIFPLKVIQSILFIVLPYFNILKMMPLRYMNFTGF